jgi:hypothetical protein
MSCRLGLGFAQASLVMLRTLPSLATVGLGLAGPCMHKGYTAPGGAANFVALHEALPNMHACMAGQQFGIALPDSEGRPS